MFSHSFRRCASLFCSLWVLSCWRNSWLSSGEFWGFVGVGCCLVLPKVNQSVELMRGRVDSIMIQRVFGRAWVLCFGVRAQSIRL